MHKYNILDVNQIDTKKVINSPYVKKIMGNILNPKITAGITLWPRKPPKVSAIGLVGLTRLLTKNPLVVYLDDICARMYTGRDMYDQEKINQEYEDFFAPYGCQIIYSSKVVNFKNFFHSFASLSSKITYLEFVSSLPIEKRESVQGLKLDECWHLVLHMMLLDKAKDKCNVLLFGDFSEAAACLYRDITNNPPSCLMLRRFPNDESEIIKILDQMKQFSN